MPNGCAAGDEAAAEAYLRRQPADTRIDLLLADWALARGEYAAALDDYQRVKRREPNNPDAQLGEIEAYVAQGDLDAARQRLKTEPQPQDASLNSQRRVANAWGAVGDPQQADALFSRLKTAAASEPAGQTKALVYRDAARLERAQQQPERAQQDYRQAMVAGGITPTLPQDNDGYTYLTRNNPNDDWLKRGIRSDAADLYRQQDVNVTLDHDYWRSSGTGGISDFNAHDTMLQVDMPLYDGRAFLRPTPCSWMPAASRPTAAASTTKPSAPATRKGAAAMNTRKPPAPAWRPAGKTIAGNADIGTTPMGFEVVDWTGGLAYSGDWNHIGWTLAASRRPISSSLLAFGGAKDPNTGITWGGVRATGVSLSASYDRGEANGVW